MKYSIEQILKAAEIGEVSMIDAKHICDLLPSVVCSRKGFNTCYYWHKQDGGCIGCDLCYRQITEKELK